MGHPPSLSSVKVEYCESILKRVPHYKKSQANKLFLRRRFFTTMMEEGDDVLSHINKLKTIAEPLEPVGAPVCEDDLVITLLGSLSDSYQLLITSRPFRNAILTFI